MANPILVGAGVAIVIVGGVVGVVLYQWLKKLNKESFGILPYASVDGVTYTLRPPQ